MDCKRNRLLPPGPGEDFFRAEAGMTARAFLSRARTLDGEIDCKLEQVMRLRSRLTSCTRLLTDVPGGGTTDWTDTVARVLELEEEINGDINRLIDLKREIRERIDAVENPTHRQLLELRYLCGMSWRKIAGKMHYSEDWVKEMHTHALEALSADFSECGASPHFTPPANVIGLDCQSRQESDD